MKRLVAKAIYGIVIIEVGAGLVLGFLAYYVRARVTDGYADGLGRSLEPTPLIVRFLVGADSLWAGWGYFFLDFLVFWGAVGLGYTLVVLANKLDPISKA